MKFTSLFSLSIILVFLACGKSPDSAKRSPSSTFALEGKSLLVFSGTDVKLESSALYFFDEESSAVEPILHGQSGDLFVKNVEGRLFAFNRKAEQHDYFEITPVKNDDGSYKFIPSDAISLAGLSVGDPHDVVLLDKGHLLLVNYISSSLAVLDIGSSKITTVKDLNFGLLQNAPLRFENAKKLSDGTIVLLRQGVSATYSIDKTQAAYFMTWDADAKILEFKDKAAPGLKLATSIPMGIFTNANEDSFATITLCSEYFVDCTSGVERLSLKTNKSEVMAGFDLKGLGFYGGTTFSSASQTIYASAVTNEKEKKVVAFDVAKGTQKDLFTFPNGLFNGYWGLIYNESSKSLYVGDAVTERKGQITIIKDSGETTTVETPAIPYSSTIYFAQ